MTALYKQQLGELIAARRSELGLTQKQLADRAHVAESQTISRWERGERAPQNLEAVASALDWTVPDMLTRLEPLGQRKRKAMGADEGLSQLDRVEAKIDALNHTLNTLIAALAGGLDGATQPSEENLAQVVQLFRDAAVQAHAQREAETPESVPPVGA